MSSFNQLGSLLAEGNIATEAIDFQVDTKFADSIRDMFQRIIEYRETCRGDKRIVTKVTDFAEKTISKELPALVKTYTGLKLEKITYTENISFFFAMQPRMGSDKDMCKIVDSMTGNRLYADDLDFRDKTYEDLKKISMTFDMKKGALGVKTFLNKDIGMNLFFDCYSAFLIRDVLNVNFEYFTAEEITAITMHEIGHMMSMVEHCGDMFFRLGLRTALIKSFVKTAPITEKIKLLRDIIKDPDAGKLMEGNSTLGSKMTLSLMKAAANVADDFDKHRKDNNNDSTLLFWETIWNFFINMFIIACLVVSAIYEPIQYFIYELIGNLCLAWSRDFMGKGGLNDPKYSDFMANKNTGFQWERWADEYVTRYGYGSHLSSGLNKLVMAASSTNCIATDAKGADVWIRNSWVPLVLNYCINGFWNICCGGNLDDGCGVYESQVDRLKRIIQDTANVFKRMDLPPEVMDKYMEEFERCQQRFNEIHTLKRCEHLYALVHRCIMSFVDPIQLGNRLLRGNIKAEYAQLANDIDDLKSNQLFYNANKLSRLIEKRG